jgi:hypothetical protein
VVHYAGLGRHRATGQVLDGVDGGVDDDGVVARGVVVDQHDHLIAAGRDAHQGVVEGLAVAVERPRRQRGQRGQVVVEPLELDVHAHLLEDPLLLGHLPREPAGPGRVAQHDGVARRLGGALGRVGRLRVIVATAGGERRGPEEHRERGGEPAAAPGTGEGRGHGRRDLRVRVVGLGRP